MAAELSVQRQGGHIEHSKQEDQSNGLNHGNIWWWTINEVVSRTKAAEKPKKLPSDLWVK